MIYDVGKDIERIQDFEPTKTVYGLFGNVCIDESCTCVFWNDMIALPADGIYEIGEEVKL